MTLGIWKKAGDGMNYGKAGAVQEFYGHSTSQEQLATAPSGIHHTY